MTNGEKAPTSSFPTRGTPRRPLNCASDFFELEVECQGTRRGGDCDVGVPAKSGQPSLREATPCFRSGYSPSNVSGDNQRGGRELGSCLTASGNSPLRDGSRNDLIMRGALAGPSNVSRDNPFNQLSSNPFNPGTWATTNSARYRGVAAL